MSHDLLVYATTLPGDLPRRIEQATAAHGIELRLHPSFVPERHAGYLPASVAISRDAPLNRAEDFHRRGTLRGGFDLYVERFEAVAPVEGLERVEQIARPLAQTIRNASRCFVVTLSREDSPAAAIAAFFTAVALVEVTGGALFEPEEDCYWDARDALGQADHYLEETFGIGECLGEDVEWSGW